MASPASNSELPSEGRGLSKGAVRRVAHGLHVEVERAELLLCLARADGLFTARTTVRSASERAVQAWRRRRCVGRVGPGTRPVPGPGQRRPAGQRSLIREALLETLLLGGSREFALVSDVEAVTCGDRRALSAQRASTRGLESGPGDARRVLDVVRVLARALAAMARVGRPRTRRAGGRGAPVGRGPPLARAQRERHRTARRGPCRRARPSATSCACWRTSTATWVPWWKRPATPARGWRSAASVCSSARPRSLGLRP